MNVTDKIEPCMETLQLRHILESNDQSDEAKNWRCEFKKGSLRSRCVYIGDVFSALLTCSLVHFFMRIQTDRFHVTTVGLVIMQRFRV